MKSSSGSWREKSTVTQLLTCYNDWASSRNTCTPTDIVFLDFTKAFDSVPYERLLLKLKGYGIEGNLLQKFLTNLQHRVVVRGTTSSRSSVRSGVPEGTILGPILFLIYVNDISSNISSTIKLFADDTKVYRETADSINDTRALQTDIDHLANWATLWQLRNPEKSETMRITHNRDKSSPSYTMGVAIKPFKCVKDLGVFISYDLT